MKGFVPVTKSSLSAMVEYAHRAVTDQFQSKWKERVEEEINRERERSETRKWYRLWIKPTPRFSFNEEGVIEFSRNRPYGMFDGCPFEALKKDKDNSHKWLNNIALIADSQHAGEPITIDTDTFRLLDNPYSYVWVSTGPYFTRPAS